MCPPTQPQARAGAVGWSFPVLSGARPDPGSGIGSWEESREKGMALSGCSQHLGWIKHIMKLCPMLLRLERLLACFFITVLALVARL